MTYVHQLKPLSLPDESVYNPSLLSWVASGSSADPFIKALMASVPTTVAVDIETQGLGADRWTVKCVSVAWDTPQGTCCILLNPLRELRDAERLRQIADHAVNLVGFNVCFDFPVMGYHGWLTLDHMDKVTDVSMLDRMAKTQRAERVTLGALDTEVLGNHGADTGTSTPILTKTTLGLDRIGDRFQVQDIDSPSYRRGSAADAVTTLRLAAPTYQRALDWLNHGYARFGITGRFDANTVVDRSIRVQQLMLRQSVRGLTINPDATEDYRAQHQEALDAAAATLLRHGITPGSRSGFVNFLTDNSLFPKGWPRTKTGKPATDKDNLEKLSDSHPVIAAYRTYAKLDREIAQYVGKVVANIGPDGRLHHGVSVHGAAKTGRMSYSDPPLQQFPAGPRAVITAPEGDELWSADWTSIEPVLLAYLSGDATFIDAYESGVGVYEQIMALTGTDRPTSKKLTLAFNYGQGAASLAEDMGVSVDTAAGYQRRIRDGWSAMGLYSKRLMQYAQQTGLMWTLGGRIVSAPEDYKAVNYHIQGGAADMLNLAILALDDAGLPDAVLLAVHDELVTTTEYHEAVGEVLRKPPAELLALTGGRVPILRAEPECLGAHWTKT